MKTLGLVIALMTLVIAAALLGGERLRGPPFPRPLERIAIALAWLCAFAGLALYSGG
jgi:hypothetical protein